MASHRGLAKDVKRGLTAPYNCWKNRIATLKFVQDIPLGEKDPSYRLVKQAGEQLHILSKLPMLICWGLRDFVFDGDYLNEWRRRFPNAEVHTFSAAGHYVLEDAPDDIIRRVKDFFESQMKEFGGMDFSLVDNPYGEKQEMYIIDYYIDQRATGSGDNFEG